MVSRTQSSPTRRSRFWTLRNSSSRFSIAVRPAADACIQMVSLASREPSSSWAPGRWWCTAARFRTRSAPLLSWATSTGSTLRRTGQMWRSLRPNELLTRLECRRTSGHSITSWCDTIQSIQTKYDIRINWKIVSLSLKLTNFIISLLNTTTIVLYSGT